MFYDDEARRFNFLSGLLLGAVLGTGLALLAVPQGRLRRSGKNKNYASLKKAVERAVRKGRGSGAWSRTEGFESLRAAARRMAR